MARRETDGREGRVLVLANVRELVEQDAEKIAWASGERPDIFSAGLGSKETGGLIVVASVQSLARNPMACGRFSLILADEAHGINPESEGQWRAIIDAQHADIIGFTGTPWRLKSGPIYGPERLFDRVTSTISIAELQELGHLVQVRSKVKPMVAENIAVRAGEFDIASQDASILPHRVADALEHHCQGRASVLVFVPGIESGTGLTATLIGRGHAAAEVYGHTGDVARADAIARFRDGRIRFLVNCGTLTTGFDAPRTDCVVLLRRTMSGALLVQMIGRGLRPSPDHKRDLLLLDYAGNFKIHPAVQDIAPPEYGKEPKKAECRVCPECDEANSPSVKSCSACGFVFPIERQKRDLRFSGDPSSMGDSRTIALEFGEYALAAKARGHKPISALIRYKEKHGTWPATSTGRAAGHPFAWVLSHETGRREVQWL